VAANAKPIAKAMIKTKIAAKFLIFLSVSKINLLEKFYYRQRLNIISAADFLFWFIMLFNKSASLPR